MPALTSTDIAASPRSGNDACVRPEPSGDGAGPRTGPGGGHSPVRSLQIRRAAASGLVLRPETEADIPFTTLLYASTRDEELAPAPWPQAAKAAFLAQQHDAQRRHYRIHYPDALWMIVERAGRPIGRLYLERWPSQHRIIDIALLPQARGKGFGTALLNDVIEEAFANGKSVSIHVEKTNPAMRLYRRLGFATAEDKGVYDLMLRTAATAPDR